MEYKVEVYWNKDKLEFFINNPIDKCLENIIHEKCIVPYIVNGKSKDGIFNRKFTMDYMGVPYIINIHYHN
jgi:hypothetical protein